MAEHECLLVGITGGIGAGKSVVSRILRLKGYPVYDCDSRARLLMEESQLILNALKTRFGKECIFDEGGLNREFIASKIFGCDEDRLWLNALVHSEVRRDIEIWRRRQTGSVCFVESAIMVSSHLDTMCDMILLVVAPEQLRIMRAVSRGGISEENLMQRIESQRFEFDSLPEMKVRRIKNEEVSSLLAQIEDLGFN